MGRHSIFRGKMNGIRVQGILTKEAGKRFEAARSDLEKLATAITGERPSVVSDSDVIEYLARGPKNTRDYLEAARP
jgi:hypothetical protein